MREYRIVKVERCAGSEVLDTHYVVEFLAERRRMKNFFRKTTEWLIAQESQVIGYRVFNINARFETPEEAREFALNRFAEQHTVYTVLETES